MSDERVYWVIRWRSPQFGTESVDWVAGELALSAAWAFRADYKHDTFKVVRVTSKVRG